VLHADASDAAVIAVSAAAVARRPHAPTIVTTPTFRRLSPVPERSL
jgi:hypothetical protein